MLRLRRRFRREISSHHENRYHGKDEAAQAFEGGTLAPGAPSVGTENSVAAAEGRVQVPQNIRNKIALRSITPTT